MFQGNKTTKSTASRVINDQKRRDFRITAATPFLGQLKVTGCHRFIRQQTITSKDNRLPIDR